MNAPLRLLAALALFVAPAMSHAQEPGPSGAWAQSTPSPQASPSPTPAPQPAPSPAPNPQPSPTPNPNATLETTLAAGDSPDEPRRELVKWNEYHGPYFTI